MIQMSLFIGSCTCICIVVSIYCVELKNQNARSGFVLLEFKRQEYHANSFFINKTISQEKNFLQKSFVWHKVIDLTYEYFTLNTKFRNGIWFLYLYEAIGILHSVFACLIFKTTFLNSCIMLIPNLKFVEKCKMLQLTKVQNLEQQKISTKSVKYV